MRTLIRCIPLTLMLAFSVHAQIPRTIAYQGILTDTLGNPRPDGAYAMTFRLYPTSSGGSAIWSESKSVQLKDGLFSTSLGDGTPFPGSLLFNAQYWLSVQVGAGAELAPRIAMTATPYSLSSEKADSARIAGGVGANAVTTSGIADNAVTSAKIQNGTIQFQDIGQNGAATGQVMKWNGTAWVAANDSLGITTGGPFLPLAGGTMTGPITNSGDPPITMGKGNFGSANINSGTHAFVAGSNNNASGDNATVGGGGFNTADGAWTTVGGGGYNNANGSNATVGGGGLNIANTDWTTIGGGGFNTASGIVATVGGGSSNTASNSYATVGGGAYNKARGQYSFVGGGGGATPADSNSALGPWSTVGGGFRNIASARSATVVGGEKNTASNIEATVSGGFFNIASGVDATVGGGNSNIASDVAATVGGGAYNKARGQYSFVGGGGGATAADSNSALGTYSTIGGGTQNIADNFCATVGGGINNRASGWRATVGGGEDNTAYGGGHATVGGGWDNTASDVATTVSGGQNNTAVLQGATVGGGLSNHATGYHSTVPGGILNNAAGDYSFAAGRRAKANHSGAFVWADGTDANFLSTAIDQFNVRASGGTRIFSNGALAAGVTLAAGASAWASVSDSTLKRNARLVDGEEILQKLVRLPIKQWSYKSQDPGVEHIGPMAQDFHNLYGLGDDDKSISTIDPAGVALAAIQELYKQNLELRERVATLEEIIKSRTSTRETEGTE